MGMLNKICPDCNEIETISSFRPTIRVKARHCPVKKKFGLLALAPGREEFPLFIKFSEVRFSEVRRSKRPAELGSRHPRAAWWHRFGVEMPRPSSVRCTIL
jgi:hypothetical protein